MDFVDTDSEEGEIVTFEEMLRRIKEYTGYSVSWEKAKEIYAPYQTFYGVGIRNIPALYEKFLHEKNRNIRKIWKMFFDIATETDIQKDLFYTPEKLSPNLC
jgi:hypothetical protein